MTKITSWEEFDEALQLFICDPGFRNFSCFHNRVKIQIKADGPVDAVNDELLKAGEIQMIEGDELNDLPTYV